MTEEQKHSGYKAVTMRCLSCGLSLFLIALVCWLLVKEQCGCRSHREQRRLECRSQKEQKKFECRSQLEQEILSVEDVEKLESGSSASNPQLASLIQQTYLVAPSTQTYALRHAHRRYFSQVGQDRYVDFLLANRTAGFFVECGAATGEELSNTLYFEKYRGWSGLLVEVNKQYFQTLLKKRRKAFAINACLSTTGRAGREQYLAAGDIGGIKDYMHTDRIRDAASMGHSNTSSVQCFPLYSLLLALHVSHVDYLSLDIEGPELEILELFPWNLVTIDVVSVEYRVGTHSQSARKSTLSKLTKLRHLFKSLSYEEKAILPIGVRDVATGVDIIFKRLH